MHPMKNAKVTVQAKDASDKKEIVRPPVASEYDSVLQISRPIPVGGDYSTIKQKIGATTKLNYLPL